jgi:hypothetical protein
VPRNISKKGQMFGGKHCSIKKQSFTGNLKPVLRIRVYTAPTLTHFLSLCILNVKNAALATALAWKAMQPRLRLHNFVKKNSYKISR